MVVATIRGLVGLMLASFVSACALPEVGAGRADWWVDAEALPLPPETTVIHGFLQERECASGGSPEGRIVGPRVEYGPEAVVVTFRVRSVGAVGFAPMPTRWRAATRFPVDRAVLPTSERDVHWARFAYDPTADERHQSPMYDASLARDIRQH
jgi:hypothetical protein